ncbi:uncharacterized transposon-derived protein F54H12.3 [Trichonephila clavipes]|nr:uncharacterized transposon-derived protein F54H12.3 [Trichonephila clavipes]
MKNVGKPEKERRKYLCPYAVRANQMRPISGSTYTVRANCLRGLSIPIHLRSRRFVQFIREEDVHRASTKELTYSKNGCRIDKMPFPLQMVPFSLSCHITWAIARDLKNTSTLRFGGVEALHGSLKGKYSKKDVKHWLSQKDAYTLHKPVRHKFQRNRVFVSDIDRQFQADLVDMQSLAEFNKGYKYLLTCIDLFSKFAWAVPLKDKFGKSVKFGLEIIFKERKPKVLQTDAGSRADPSRCAARAQHEGGQNKGRPHIIRSIK